MQERDDASKVYFDSLELEQKIEVVMCLSDTMLSQASILLYCNISYFDLPPDEQTRLDSVFQSLDVTKTPLGDLTTLYSLDAKKRSELREKFNWRILRDYFNFKYSTNHKGPKDNLNREVL